MSDETQEKRIEWTILTLAAALFCGAALTIGGVFVLYGLGPSLLTAGGLSFLLAAVIIRGLLRGK